MKKRKNEKYKETVTFADNSLCCMNIRNGCQVNSTVNLLASNESNCEVILRCSTTEAKYSDGLLKIIFIMKRNRILRHVY